MNDNPDPPTQITRLLGRIGEGDSSARNDLFRIFSERLEHLARQMLKKFPGVRRREQTGDIVQEANLRLLQSLEAIKVESGAHFLNLAAGHIRFALLDLARRYQKPLPLAGKHATQGKSESAAGSPEALHDPGEDTNDPSQLALWTEFHERAAALPKEEREVFDLLFYHGLEQSEAASLLRLSERTLKRRWQAVRLKLHDALGRLPA